MHLNAAMELLRSLRPDADDMLVEIGHRGDAAFLRIWQLARPSRWAVVSTPGDRWFAVEVDGGYSLNHFEEDTREEDVHRLLSTYVGVAMAYLRSDAAAVRVRRFRAPVLNVPNEEGQVELRMSMVAGFKAAMRPPTRRGA